LKKATLSQTSHLIFSVRFSATVFAKRALKVTQATCDIVSHEKIVFDDKNRESMGTVCG